MPKLSNKGNAMPASPIRKLAPYAEAAKKKGVNIFHLNIGQPDIETPEKFWEELKHMDMKVLSYAPSDGYPVYKQQFAKYYNSVGINVSSENFMITNGGSEALLFTMMSVLNEGEEIIIPEPMYANYIGFAHAGNIRVKPISTSIENGFALPEIASFEKLITDKTKAILICNPNNPTGYLYSEAELQTLRELCLKYDLFLIVDEVYREFVYEGKKHFSALNLKDVEQNVIVIDSISKRFSACGARIGAIVTRNKEMLAIALKFGQARLSPPSLGQLAGAALFDLPASYYQKVVEEYAERRNVLVEKLNAIDGVKCPNPGGAFYCVAELPVENVEDFCQWMLEHFSYKNSTVMMAPASGFYSTETSGKNQVRIAYVLNQTDLIAALECLAEGLKAYRKK
ncbi:MAG: pyridoxal phosphate-dependent aminotransferase [Chitinophagales bacterium]|nr:pyridoxal phosphate-dependent aminotransferase [Chitinophagales bacterium]